MSKSTAPRCGPYRLVIFDCDGVLVDSEPLANRVLAESLTEAGFPTTPAECERRFTGRTYRAVVEMVELETARRLPGAFRETVQARTLSLFPTQLRAIAGIAELAREVPTAKCVASSSSVPWIRLALETTGLLSLFEPHLFSAAMVAEGKPAPDLFLHAASCMGVRSEECLVVEDSVAGVMAAQAARMRVFGFTGGGHTAAADYRDRLQAAGADRVCADAQTLREALGAALNS